MMLVAHASLPMHIACLTALSECVGRLPFGLMSRSPRTGLPFGSQLPVFGRPSVAGGRLTAFANHWGHSRPTLCPGPNVERLYEK
jgi:hypothetical protein